MSANEVLNKGTVWSKTETTHDDVNPDWISFQVNGKHVSMFLFFLLNVIFLFAAWCHLHKYVGCVFYM